MVTCSPMTTFTFNLTDDQRQLCSWVADHARAGVDRIWYADVKTALNIADDEDVTRLLREIRERRDTICGMVHSPLVNTNDPYFDLHRDADCIWDDYCRAERELDVQLDAQGSRGLEDLYVAGANRVPCAV